MNSLRYLPDKTEGLKPMKKVFLQEFMNLTIISETSFAPPKMLNPVAARILKICRKTLLYLTTVHLTRGGVRSAQVTNISLKFFGHKPQAALG
jgi:hypothetical protein